MTGKGLVAAPPAGSRSVKGTPEQQDAESMHRRRTLWIWLRSTLLNLPLMLGLIIIGGIILLAALAPWLTTASPFEEHSLLKIAGQYMPAPFEPGADGRFPLGSDYRGRDLWTVLLYGARTTLYIAAMVVVGRTLLGVIAGMLAGWFHDTWADRVLMTLSGLAAAFPALIFGLVAIIALDIRSGARAFIIGLALTGWSELAQYIRSEVLVIRRKPYIEGARTIGMSEAGLLLRHVLPNLMPVLVMMAALEMSAVLIVLGELGFLGILVGGGIREVEETFTRTASSASQSFDLPEWGGVLAYARRAVISAPWIALYSSIAFALAILGFNLLGEGLRRLLEQTEIAIARIFKLRYLATVVVLALLFFTVSDLLSPASYYANLARGFDAQQAMNYTRSVADPRFGGRRAGTPNERAAAEWIAGQFKAMGLEPGGDKGSYFQQFPIDFVDIAEAPQLVIKDEQEHVLENAKHRQDFSEVISGYAGQGQADGQVVFVGWGTEVKDYSDYGLEVKDRVLLQLQGGPQSLTNRSELAIQRGAKAILFISRDPGPVNNKGSYGTTFEKTTIPELVISWQTADTLLQGTGWTAAKLYQQYDARWQAAVEQNRGLRSDESNSFALNKRAAISVKLTTAKRTSQNVIGYIPGSDATRKELPIIIGAHYDHTGEDPGGAVFQGANDDASGVGTMLEMVHLAQVQQIRPRNTIIFIAFGAEEAGLAGSNYYARNPNWEIRNTVAMIQIESVGAGNGPGLGVSDEAYGFYTQLRGAAQRLGVPTAYEYVPDGNDQASFTARGVPAAMLYWTGAFAEIHRTTDTLDRLDPQKLRGAGMTAYLMMLQLGA